MSKKTSGTSKPATVKTNTTVVIGDSCKPWKPSRVRIGDSCKPW